MGIIPTEEFNMMSNALSSLAGSTFRISTVREPTWALPRVSY